MTLRYFDAHNHLQDERFGGRQAELIAVCRAAGVAGMVVNGACEADWPAVAALARTHPDLILPAFGYHPWYMGERTAEWENRLRACLREHPGASVGEIGLDRWKAGLDFTVQQEVFARQLRLAAEWDLPVSIHCLQAWGPLYDVLRTGPRPARGFLLHSYGGPAELVEPLTRLGAYFSLPGYYAHERKRRQRETFRRVPADRLLIETDAPDQPLPEPRVCYRLPPGIETSGDRPLNHPANLGAVYAFAAEWLGCSPDALTAQIEAHFIRLFGPLPAPPPAPAGPPTAPSPAPPPQNQTSP